jgi:hypothetical protein
VLDLHLRIGHDDEVFLTPVGLGGIGIHRATS